MDTGTHESLLDAATFIKVVEDRQGLKIACLEEIAFRMKLINEDQLEKNVREMGKSHYGRYLSNFLKHVKPNRNVYL
jgi:glucose-1-phosphate thymidylyltransferase